jgi:small-conductance mechanosensitive channel
MIDGPEIILLVCAASTLAAAFIHRLRAYRSLLIGGGVLLVITAVYPRRGNQLGQLIFGPVVEGLRLPSEVFGVVWWILGAWLVKSVLALILRRTLFPNDNQPHARRLFADLASGLVYVVALVGIMQTVLKQPISTVLATSGVIAIVIGLALQNTLADVFAGLAINVERPFGAGDWITVNTLAEGQVMEINWRATRLKTTSNDIIVLPNSVIAKAVVTNHRRINDPLWRAVAVSIDHGVSPTGVMETLQQAAIGVPGLARGFAPIAYATSIGDSAVQYELSFAIEDFADVPSIQSEVVKRLVDALNRVGISIGSAPIEVRIVDGGSGPVGKSPSFSSKASAPSTELPVATQ